VDLEDQVGDRDRVAVGTVALVAASDMAAMVVAVEALAVPAVRERDPHPERGGARTGRRLRLEDR